MEKNIQKQLKVLFLITDLGRGGAERSITDLALEFNRRPDVVVKIGALYKNNAFPEYDGLLDITYLDYETFSFRKRNYTKKYHDLIDKFQPDIVHSNRFLAEFLTAEEVYPNISYVCHGHDNMIQLNNFGWNTLLQKSTFLNFLEKQILVFKKYRKTKTHFIANSKDTYAYFKQVLPTKVGTNIHTIYNAVSLVKFQPQVREPISSDRKIKIINVGSFQVKKNQIFLIEIAHLLRKRGLNFEMNLLGDGSEKSNVQQAINDNNLKDFVFLRGIQNNVEQWLKESDIYVHSAWYEPFGIVLIEAMATGLPIVTLDGKGNRDIMEHGKNGFLIEHQEAEKFVNHIISLVENQDLYTNMSQYCSNYAKQFDIEAKGQEYIDFYNSILKNNISR
jgi:glycosyltransferase involved in cell wall biosynthesis